MGLYLALIDAEGGHPRVEKFAMMCCKQHVNILGRKERIKVLERHFPGGIERWVCLYAVRSWTLPLSLQESTLPFGVIYAFCCAISGLHSDLIVSHVGTQKVAMHCS